MATMPMIGQEVAGYRLTAVLGRGGMSVVYRAEYMRVGNVVALKVLSPELATDDAFRARFLQESRVAASLNHPNVVPIYDSGPFDDLLFISMRYVSGADLRRVLKERGRLAPEVAMPLIAQTGRALDAAHRADLIHRDVKPGNILIERGGVDEPDHVYLADFGITKHALSISGLTATGHFVGTLDYIAPEQIQGREVDARADIYSLGCVLYESVTGRVPFRKDVDAAVIWAHVEESPEPPNSVCPDVPEALDDVIMRAMAKDPADRFGSCREFVAAAQAALTATIGETHTADSAAGRGITPTVVPAAAQISPIEDATFDPEPAAVREPMPSPAGGALSAPASPLEPSPPSGRPPGTGDAAGAAGQSPRRRAVPWAIAAAAVVVAVVVVVLATRGGGSTTSKTMTATHAGHGLMQAAISANANDFSKGLLPPSSCTSSGSTVLTCTNPVPAISTVRFQTYPSLPALYAAYTKQFRILSGSAFKQNFNNCTTAQTYGEVSWNHASEHSKLYSVSQMMSGHTNLNDAFGRLFCTFSTSGDFYIGWTNDPDHLLGLVTGNPHDATWGWWHKIHHTFSLSGNGMSMSMGK